MPAGAQLEAPAVAPPRVPISHHMRGWPEPTCTGVGRERAHFDASRLSLAQFLQRMEARERLELLASSLAWLPTPYINWGSSLSPLGPHLLSCRRGKEGSGRGHRRGQQTGTEELGHQSRLTPFCAQRTS